MESHRGGTEKQRKHRLKSMNYFELAASQVIKLRDFLTTKDTKFTKEFIKTYLFLVFFAPFVVNFSSLFLNLMTLPDRQAIFEVTVDSLVIVGIT